MPPFFCLSPSQSTYTYDGDGRRVRRQSNGQTTWQVYGIEGELVAEYGAGVAPTAPQQEYGYRNGEMLITASAAAPAAGVNLALGKAATQSSDLYGQVASHAVDGNTTSTMTHTNLDNQAWWQVDLGNVQTIQTIKVYNRTDCCFQYLTSFYVLVSDVPFTSTDLNTTLNQAGVNAYYTAGQGGSPTSIAVNRTGRYVRVQLSGANYLSMAEVEVWGISSDLALGKAATQSSTLYGGASLAVDGNTTSTMTHTNLDNQAWWQVDLGSVQSIQTIKVYNRTDCCFERLSNFYVLVSDVPFTSTDLTTTLNQAGVSNYYTAGQGGSPTSIVVNRTGRYVRVQLTGANYLSMAEVEVNGGPSGNASTGNIQWMVTDQLGTPRIIADRTGSLAGIRRHDYLPYGEEMMAGSGNRTVAGGYVADAVRQKFTAKERDTETGLDYFQARYYSSSQGRFTSADSFPGAPMNPQTLNLYTYVQNNPLAFVDPTGHFLANAVELSRRRARIAAMEESWREDDYAAFGYVKGTESQPPAPQASASTSQNSELVQAYSSNSTMTTIWDALPKNESWNPDRWFGHVSYITMQDNTSYSWQGIMNWTIDNPSSNYTDKRSKDSAGMGYILDFGPKINAKFQKAMLSAYDTFIGVNVPYGPVNYNCGRAFNVAINAIRKDIGVPKSNFVLPSGIKAYIETNLQKYIVSQTQFPKH